MECSIPKDTHIFLPQSCSISSVYIKISIAEAFVHLTFLLWTSSDSATRACSVTVNLVLHCGSIPPRDLRIHAKCRLSGESKCTVRFALRCTGAEAQRLNCSLQQRLSTCLSQGAAVLPPCSVAWKLYDLIVMFRQVN